MIAKADYIDNTNLDMVGIINIQHPDIQTSKHPTPGKVNFFFLKYFFRKCECIRSCYLPISSNLCKKSLS